ncbi:MAG TPA: hypothetical protein DCW35_01020 [Polynucleobacter sp.]|nr:hypothetical protein [Polynucleobacter sp.]
MTLPNVSVKATNGQTINFGGIKGKLVIYCYPMTGQSNVVLPDGLGSNSGSKRLYPSELFF